VNEKKMEGIVHANDESDRTGMRIVFALAKDANANVVLNKLYKNTALQTSFSVNNVALVNGKPQMLNLKDLIHYFVEHRHEVVLRRTRFELNQAEEKAHILEGLIIAIDHLDEVISLIRASKTPEEAKLGLMEKFALSERQAKAILEMRLQKLTGLERDKLRFDYEELMTLIEYLKSILESYDLQMKIIKDELLEVTEKYGDKRKTDIIYASEDLNPEDFYANDDMVITISHLGYIKRTQLSEFRTQNRGGVGAKASTTRDLDFLENIFTATMHNTLLLFTEKGKCFWLKVYEIPEGSKTSKGRAIQNILNIEADDKVKAYINVEALTNENYIRNNHIILCTKKGVIKKTLLQAYSRPRNNGINAIGIREGDSLLEAKLTNGTSEIILAVRTGKAIRFNESKVRPVGRTASGVKGVTITENDEVIGMVCINSPEDNILVVSENGYGKRSLLDDYRITNRGGKGVKTMNVTEKTGALIAIKSVTDENDIMIITKSGLTLRIAVDTLRLMGRATQGVRLIKLREDESIADVAKVPKSEEVVVTPVIAETPSEYSDNDNINELENILLDEEIIDNEEEELLEEELPEEELMEEEDSEDDISDIEEEEEE